MDQSACRRPGNPFFTCMVNGRFLIGLTSKPMIFPLNAGVDDVRSRNNSIYQRGITETSQFYLWYTRIPRQLIRRTLVWEKASSQVMIAISEP